MCRFSDDKILYNSMTDAFPYQTSVPAPLLYNLVITVGLPYRKHQLARSPEITGRAGANDISSALNMVDYEN